MAVFRRKIYDTLLEWKNLDCGKCAVLLQGARRIGKTTVAREFAKNEYASYILIDFLKPKKGTLEIFESYYNDVGLLLSNLSILYSVTLRERRSLIIFDEVQNYPKARQLIKYLVADGRYDYLETGSLISIKKNVESIQIPSEEKHVEMYPMDFEEFLWADGDTVTVPYIRECFISRKPLGQTLHAVAMERYKTYMLVGGMPQAVDAYVNGHDVAAAEKSKKAILDLYRDDMAKIPVGNGTKAGIIFERVPAMLSSHRKVFRPSSVGGGIRSSDYEDSVKWLADARICNICRGNSDPNITLNLDSTEAWKCYLLDTGLLITLSFDAGAVVLSDVYQAFIKGKLSINEGMFFENMVAQELVRTGHSLYFSEFYDGDDKHLYEVDFLLSLGRKISPIEVKSSVSGKHRSLDLFLSRYKARVKEAFVIHGKDLRSDGKITYVPIYMTMFLDRAV